MFFRCQMKGIYLQAPGAYAGAQWSRAAKMTSHRNIDQHKVPNSTETKRFIIRRSKPKVQIRHSLQLSLAKWSWRRRNRHVYSQLNMFFL